MSHLVDLKQIIKELHGNGAHYSSFLLENIIDVNHELLNMKDFNAEGFLGKIWRDIQEKENNSLEGIKRNVFSNIGSQNINLIPSEQTSDCKPFCLAIANGAFGEKHYKNQYKTGFKGMMFMLIRNWFSCLAVNRETLILTLQWDSNSFNESYEPLITEFCKTHNKKVFIIHISNSNANLMFSK